MKKIIGIIVIVAVVVVGFFGFQYYQNTYNGHEAYAKVPTTVPEKHETKDSNGKVIGNSYSYDYTFTFVTPKGEKVEMGYTLIGEDPQPLTPGAYISAEISKTRIVSGPNDIEKSKIPLKSLEILESIN